MLVVLTETLANQNSITALELRNIEEAARLFGCRVYSIPEHIDNTLEADELLPYVTHFDKPILGLWMGFIPSYERYEAIYNAALKKNIYLANTPNQHRTAMEFDQFYPLLQGLTPQSIIVDRLDAIASIENLAFPVFVKGAIKSNKDEGWSAVLANNMEELLAISQNLFARQGRSRGKIIIRELVQLKQVATAPNGFPISREYRAFLYQDKLLAYGFYWDYYEDKQKLVRTEKQEFLNLLHQATHRLNVPFLAIDIGQLINGDWIIIEVGDAQFSGLSTIPILELWSKLKDLEI